MVNPLRKYLPALAVTTALALRSQVSDHFVMVTRQPLWSAIQGSRPRRRQSEWRLNAAAVRDLISKTRGLSADWTNLPGIVFARSADEIGEDLAKLMKPYGHLWPDVFMRSLVLLQREMDDIPDQLLAHIVGRAGAILLETQPITEKILAGMMRTVHPISHPTTTAEASAALLTRLLLSQVADARYAAEAVVTVKRPFGDHTPFIIRYTAAIIAGSDAKFQLLTNPILGTEFTALLTAAGKNPGLQVVHDMICAEHLKTLGPRADDMPETPTEITALVRGMLTNHSDGLLTAARNVGLPDSYLAALRTLQDDADPAISSVAKRILTALLPT